MALSKKEKKLIRKFELQCRRHTGDTIGALNFFVSMEDIELLDAQIRHLNTDILTLRPKTSPQDGQAHLKELASIIAFQSNWVTFHAGWRHWVDTHFSTLSRVGENSVQEYEDFQAGYNEWLRQYKEAWGKTSAKKSTQTPQGGTAFENVTGTINTVAIAVMVAAGAYVIGKVL